LARQSGNAEEIETCLKLLNQKKQELRQLKEANVDPQLASKIIQCKANLREARMAGREEAIQACASALREAKKEMKL